MHHTHPLVHKSQQSLSFLHSIPVSIKKNCSQMNDMPLMLLLLWEYSGLGRHWMVALAFSPTLDSQRLSGLARGHLLTAPWAIPVLGLWPVPCPGLACLRHRARADFFP